MTEYTAHLIVGRPVGGLRDWGEDHVRGHLGVDVPEGMDWRERADLVPGLQCLYQGDAFVGVRVRDLLAQFSGPVSAGKLDLSVPPEKEAEARRLCDALPERLRDHPMLMPFGVYVVGSDG